MYDLQLSPNTKKKNRYNMVGPVENHYFSIQIDLSAIYRPRVGVWLGFQAIIINCFPH